ncbi:hypothetical protein C5E05_15320 [Pseudoclavibacter sp. AY1H1]|nr:hypothetical protein C5E05_15320 [Pseudoclavibacter sp. AY1H1]
MTRPSSSATPAAWSITRRPPLCSIASSVTVVEICEARSAAEPLTTSVASGSLKGASARRCDSSGSPSPGWPVTSAQDSRRSASNSAEMLSSRRSSTSTPSGFRRSVLVMLATVPSRRGLGRLRGALPIPAPRAVARKGGFEHTFEAVRTCRPTPRKCTPTHSQTSICSLLRVLSARDADLRTPVTAAAASPDAATIAFSVNDGVALSTALTQHVAREQGIRMLVIKGPISADLGLRTRRYSTDVDIIVEPGRAKDLIEALQAYGWRPRPWPDFPKLLEQHSRTLIHESWPNDIDVHHYWPGFLGRPQEAFDRLWAHHIQVTVAGHPIDTPDRAGSALVLALHSLREEGQVSADSRQMTEYSELVSALKKMDGSDTQFVSDARSTASLTEQILQDAVGTDSTQTARRFLTDLGHDVPLVPNSNASEALRLWRLNAKAEHAMTGWMLKLQRAPLLEKPGIAARAFFPSRADLAAIDPELRNGTISVVRAWWKRASRGLHGLVQARRDLKAFDKR